MGAPKEPSNGPQKSNMHAAVAKRIAEAEAEKKTEADAKKAAAVQQEFSMNDWLSSSKEKVPPESRPEEFGASAVLDLPMVSLAAGLNI